MPKFTGMKRMASGRRSIKSSGLSKSATGKAWRAMLPKLIKQGATRRGGPRVLCVKGTGCADLRVGHFYTTMPDAKAKALGLLRVVDDSGEDYLYPVEYFRVGPRSRPSA